MSSRSTPDRKASRRQKPPVVPVRVITSAQRSSFVLCVEDGDKMDLQVGKVYRARRTKREESLGLLRVYDDSKESYLYPESWFKPVQLSKSVRQRLLQDDAFRLVGAT